MLPMVNILIYLYFIDLILMYMFKSSNTGLENSLNRFLSSNGFCFKNNFLKCFYFY